MQEAKPDGRVGSCCISEVGGRVPSTISGEDLVRRRLCHQDEWNVPLHSDFAVPGGQQVTLNGPVLRNVKSEPAMLRNIGP